MTTMADFLRQLEATDLRNSGRTWCRCVWLCPEAAPIAQPAPIPFKFPPRQVIATYGRGWHTEFVIYDERPSIQDEMDHIEFGIMFLTPKVYPEWLKLAPRRWFGPNATELDLIDARSLSIHLLFEDVEWNLKCLDLD